LILDHLFVSFLAYTTGISSKNVRLIEFAKITQDRVLHLDKKIIKDKEVLLRIANMVLDEINPV